MPDGFVPLPSLTGDLAQHELSRSVIGSDLQLFLEFCLCALHIRRRLRKKNAPDTIVNARQLRLLLEDPLVFGNGLIPVFLRLEGFCLELLRLMRCGRSRRQLPRCTRCELRIEVGRAVEHVGIVRKLAVENEQGLNGGFRLLKTHCASSRRHHCAVFELLVHKMRSGLFQNRQGFPAAASRREADALLCRGRSFSRRGFWQPLCAGEGRGKCRNAERADANPEESNHTECRTPWRRFAKYILCLR